MKRIHIDNETQTALEDLMEVFGVSTYIAVDGKNIITFETLEWQLLQQVKQFRCKWIPKCFGGYTECFTLTEEEGLDIWYKLV